MAPPFRIGVMQLTMEPLDEMLASDLKQRLVANGTYNPDGTANLDTARRLGWDKVWERQPPARVLRSSIMPPSGTTFHFFGANVSPPALTLDGRRLAFASEVHDEMVTPGTK